MKKAISLFLTMVLVLSLTPLSLATEGSESQEVTVQTPVQTTEPYQYTESGETVDIQTTVEVTDKNHNDDSAATSTENTSTENTSTENTSANSDTSGANNNTQESKLPAGVYDVQNDVAVNKKEIIDEETLVTEDECIVQKGAAKDGTHDVLTPTENKIVETGGTDGCEHTYGDYEILREATCSECGIKQATCTKCTCVKTELIDKTEHKKESGTFQRSVNCADTPYDEYKCTTCNEYYEIPNGAAKVAHTMENGVCTVCGYVESTYGTVTNEDTNKKAAEYTFVGDTLTLSKGSGTGELQDYTTEVTLDTGDVLAVPETDATPWAQFADQVKNLIINNGITRIGDWTFGMLNNLQTVEIRSDKISIGDYAFAEDPSLVSVTFTSTTAAVTYDHETNLVEYPADSDPDVIIQDQGSTAYFDDGDVTINYNCANKKASAQKTKMFAGDVDVHYGCYHNNVVTRPGKAPTETKPGLTDGLYCKDCKTWIQPQQKIYPNGKKETGKYEITEFKDWKKIPDALKNNSKYNTLELLKNLQKDFEENLNKAMQKAYKRDLLKDNYKIYDIEMVEYYTVKEPETHIINIPYPYNTWPSTHDYIVVQIQNGGKSGTGTTFKTIEGFMTNKGIQVELTELSPIGIAYKEK